MSNTKFAVVTCVAALLLASLAAQAFPPPGGGGGTGGGTIYYMTNEGLKTMNSDGSNQVLLPAGVGGEPSFALHGGFRWHLYTSNDELHAVRSDGVVAVQLTDSFDGIAVAGGLRWAKDNSATTLINEADSFVSYVGTDASGASAIYRAYVAFDAAGTPSLSGASQAVLAIPASDYDWSPSGTQVVYSVNNALYVSQIGGPTSLLTTGHQPEWSPSGAKFAFLKPDGIVSDLCTINPDGSGLATLVQARNHTFNWITYDSAHWSPGSTHLTYHRVGPPGSGIWDIYRVGVNGGSTTFLTGGNPAAWR
ncbi:MAG TPA: hypothetical protein VGM03_05315 [Phycisphaerae bacterium]|jgi:hypothetical protein